ncbi:MAG: bifunctional precorrin-2 dehydrogenase/sirohydrochlorin ferrochelatase [Deltaproteobacteria bacterium]|nr:MAG: bifunctional precorrin-2 dehydrogenase/sirohydrochlorin ferrochelatase [Deltaproteobacteria bacterium]
MRYYPINVNIKGKRCLIVGGGQVAERKAERLLKAGAKVVVISSRLTPKLKRLSGKGLIENIARNYRKGDLKGAVLAFGATNAPGINRRILREAREEGVLLNAVDDPQNCDFTVPSMVSRGELLISISTGGKSPALSQKIRKELEDNYGQEYETLLSLLSAVRERLVGKDNSKQNKAKFKKLVDSNLLRLIRDGEIEQIDKLLRDVLGKGYCLAELNLSL